MIPAIVIILTLFIYVFALVEICSSNATRVMLIALGITHFLLTICSFNILT